MKKIIIMLTALLVMGLNSVRAAEQDLLVSTNNTTLQLFAVKGEPLKFAYYGPRLNEQQASDLWVAGDAMNRKAYPTFNDWCPDECAIMVKHANGQMMLNLVVESVERTATNGGELFTIKTKDKVQPFYANICYRTYQQADVIETWVELTNREKKDVVLMQYASAYLPVRSAEAWLSHQHGQWGNECNMTEEPLTPGMKVISNRDGGRNSHLDHPELMLSLDGKPTETSGRVIGAALCWSGNYKLRIATDALDTHLRHLIAGIDETAADYRLRPGQTLRTPELALTFSTTGKGGVSRNMHRWARQYKLHNGMAVRDVLLNSWEGVYLDITEEKMMTLMEGVKQLGGELFVMDDGWFASEKYNRDKDNAALGDWDVDKRKLPGGVQPLIDKATQLGLKFGIWIEPEMGNWKASALYDKHPDWFLQNTGVEPVLQRGGTQATLDLCNPKVQDFVFDIVDRLMTEYPQLYYIKWDDNAPIVNYGSAYLGADRQSQLYTDYHLGLRKVLERIRAKYPRLVIQDCASGGGRVNYGMLPYFDEFWTSDNTDALQRVYIQWGTSQFFPANAMAAHVSASPNHQTGRRVPLKFRFDVAESGRLGVEMKPSDFNADETRFAQQAIADYKRLRPIIQLGDLYRLRSPYEQDGMAAASMYVSANKQQAVLFAYKLKHYVGHNIAPIRLQGLDANKRYRIHEINKADDSLKSLDGKVISGKVLMEAGLNLALDKEYASRMIELTAE